MEVTTFPKMLDKIRNIVYAIAIDNFYKPVGHERQVDYWFLNVPSLADPNKNRTITGCIYSKKVQDETTGEVTIQFTVSVAKTVDERRVIVHDLQLLARDYDHLTNISLSLLTNILTI